MSLLVEEHDDDEPVPSDLAAMLNPAWLFRCRPADFAPPGLCPGLLYFPGLFFLFLLHLVICDTFLLVWNRCGWTLWLALVLVPLLTVWAVLGAADIKFRRQCPTAGQREAFDRAVVNWVGLLGYLVLIFAAAPIGGVVLACWLFGVFG